MIVSCSVSIFISEQSEKRRTERGNTHYGRSLTETTPVSRWKQSKKVSLKLVFHAKCSRLPSLALAGESNKRSIPDRQFNTPDLRGTRASYEPPPVFGPAADGNKRQTTHASNQTHRRDRYQQTESGQCVCVRLNTGNNGWIDGGTHGGDYYTGPRR